MMMPSKFTLLVVEDSDEDYELTIWALQRAGFSQPVMRSQSVDETLDFLNPETPGDQSDAARPCLVLLDINLPDGSGLEVLENVRTDTGCTTLPMVVHTTSNSPQDLERCYRLGAAGYLIKPLDRASFAQQIQAFVDYWFKAVTLPLHWPCPIMPPRSLS